MGDPAKYPPNEGMPGRDFTPADEHVPDKACPNIEPHEDHYWREDGKRFRYLNDPTTVYCSGVTQSGRPRNDG